MSDVIDISDLDLADKITVGEQITWGGFSNIYNGILTTNSTEIKVALKSLRVQGNAIPKTQERLRKRFYREVLLWRRLQHPNVVPLLGYMMLLSGFPTLISPWYINGNVIEYIALNPTKNRRPLALDVVNGLDYLHSIPVAHGDLKGENVLVNGEGRASLCDFGMSQFTDEASRISGFTTTNANSGGTDRFMCPEQVLEDAPKSAATDMWALGCLIVQILADVIPYHHLTGRSAVLSAIMRGHLPMEGSNNKIDSPVWECVQKCWSRAQADRPRASELGSALALLAEANAQRVEDYNSHHPNPLVQPIHLTSIQNPITAMVTSSNPTIPKQPYQGDGVVDVRGIGSSKMVWLPPLSWSNQLNTPDPHPDEPGATSGSDVSIGPGFPTVHPPSVKDCPPLAPKTSGKRLREHSPEQARIRSLKRERESGRRQKPNAPTQTPIPPSASAILDLTTLEPNGPSPPNRSLTMADLIDLRSEQIPSELKKEGFNWFAIFNPKAKRALDISLSWSLPHESIVTCVKFSGDGKYLATGCHRTAQIYNVRTGAKILTLLDETAPKHGDLFIRSACFSPDGQFLATGADDKQIRIWDITERKLRAVFRGHEKKVYSLDFSKDGSKIVSGSGDHTVRVWDMGTHDARVLRIESDEASVRSVAISPNGNYVAAASSDTLVRIWDMRDETLVGILRGHSDGLYSIAFTPDGNALVSGSLDKTLRYWDLTPMLKMDGSKTEGTSVKSIDLTWREFKSNPANTAMKEGGGYSSTCTGVFIGHTNYVLSVAVSPDGAWLVSGSQDCGIWFWDPKTSQAQLMVRGHTGTIFSVDLSPAGGLLATGSGDCTVRVWSYCSV